MKRGDWEEIARLVGFPLDDRQIEKLDLYRDWLRDEAIPAGGLGPAEAIRLDSRHIIDSLLFATPLDSPPTDIADLGTGVGLPGIPLAILFPNSRMCLIDRSQKRLDLAKRATRILDLDNIDAVQTDLSSIDRQYQVIVSRAARPPEQLAIQLQNLLPPGGTAVVGGSWEKRPQISGWEILEISAEMLDRAVWLLIMRRQ